MISLTVFLPLYFFQPHSPQPHPQLIFLYFVHSGDDDGSNNNQYFLFHQSAPCLIYFRCVGHCVWSDTLAHKSSMSFFHIYSFFFFYYQHLKKIIYKLKPGFGNHVGSKSTHYTLCSHSPCFCIFYLSCLHTSNPWSILLLYISHPSLVYCTHFAGGKE